MSYRELMGYITVFTLYTLILKLNQFTPPPHTFIYFLQCFCLLQRKHDSTWII